MRNQLELFGTYTVSKAATKKLKLTTSEPWEHPRVTDVTAHDTLDSKMACTILADTSLTKIRT